MYEINCCVKAKKITSLSIEIQILNRTLRIKKMLVSL